MEILKISNLVKGERFHKNNAPVSRFSRQQPPYFRFLSFVCK